MSSCCNEMSNHADDSSEDQVGTYTCPMHPKVQQDKPDNCPECGMNLVPANRRSNGLLSRLFSSRSK